MKEWYYSLSYSTERQEIATLPFRLIKNPPRLRRPPFVDELDDLRRQLGGNHHHRPIFIVQGGFDFRNRLFFGLIVVVRRELADARFVPCGRVLLILDDFAVAANFRFGFSI
jgi:hypothetical protein